MAVPSLAGHVRILEEHPEHFVAQSIHDGLRFHLPKKNMSPSLIAYARGMAHGGEVVAGGGGGTDPEGSSDAGGGGAIATDAAKAAAKPKGDAKKLEPEPGHHDSKGEEIPSGPVRMADGGDVPDAAPFGGVDPAQYDFDREIGRPAALPTPAQPTPLDASIPPLLARPPDFSPESIAQQIGAPPPPPGSAPTTMGAPPPPPEAQSPAPAMPGMGGSGTASEISAAAKQQQDAVMAQAKAEEARNQAVMELEDRHLQERQALDAAFTEQYQAHQRRAEDLFQSVLSAHIDPRRLWSNASTSERVSAGIGILLSGIGVGLAGGKNLALEQIDKSIERDIDAQKTGLATRRGVLAHYLEQGHDMLAAHQMAKADLSDALAGQVVRVSAQFGGPEALARGQLLSGQIREGAAVKRQEVMARDFQLSLERMQMQQQQQQTALMRGFLTSSRSPLGGSMVGGDLLNLPAFKDFRERAVRLPDGSYGFAGTKEEAGKSNEAMAKVDGLREKLRRYGGLLESGSPRLPAVAGGDRGSAQALHAAILSEIGHLHDLNRLTDQDVKIFREQVPDISALFSSGATSRQKLEELGQELNDKVLANGRQYLGLP